MSNRGVDKNGGHGGLCFRENEKGVYLQSALANLTSNVVQWYAPITAPFVNTFLGGINTHAKPWGWQSQFGNGEGDQTYPYLLTQFQNNPQTPGGPAPVATPAPSTPAPVLSGTKTAASSTFG